MAHRQMTLAACKVLRAMLDDPVGGHYGLSLAKRARLSAATLYPILARLEQDGFVVGEWEDIDESREGRRRRRYYRLTPHGSTDAARLLHELSRELNPPAGRNLPGLATQWGLP